jgi:transcriptional regulator with XRE-family HTH domain
MDSRLLGRVLRERRGALNMTQPDVAERAGVSLAYVYMLETGGIPQPELDALLRVAQAIDYVRLTALLEGVKAMGNGRPLSPSVEALAVADAVDQFLRELRASLGRS